MARLAGQEWPERLTDIGVLMAALYSHLDNHFSAIYLLDSNDAILIPDIPSPNLPAVAAVDRQIAIKNGQFSI